MGTRSGIQPGDDGPIWLGGLSARTLVPGTASEGRFAVVEHRLLAREFAAPLHRHSREDEFSLVTDGEIGFVLGDDVVTAGPGTWVRKPRAQWHTFYNAGDEQARLLEVISPAGFEDYFVELAAFFPADAPPDLDGMAAVTAEYGLEMDLSSMPELVERFDLARPPEMDG